MANLSEISDETVINPIQHVPGPLNPADIPTRDTTTANEVADGSIWQSGPPYLLLPREQWPFSRDFLDYVPTEELRSPKAVFGLAGSEPWISPLGAKLTSILEDVMLRTNRYSKSVLDFLSACTVWIVPESQSL